MLSCKNVDCFTNVYLPVVMNVHWDKPDSSEFLAGRFTQFPQIELHTAVHLTELLMFLI